jgi:hypothetical protein
MMPATVRVHRQVVITGHDLVRPMAVDPPASRAQQTGLAQPGPSGTRRLAAAPQWLTDAAKAAFQRQGHGVPNTWQGVGGEGDAAARRIAPGRSYQGQAPFLKQIVTLPVAARLVQTPAETPQVDADQAYVLLHQPFLFRCQRCFLSWSAIHGFVSSSPPLETEQEGLSAHT